MLCTLARNIKNLDFRHCASLILKYFTFFVKDGRSKSFPKALFHLKKHIMLKGPHFCARLKSMWQEQNFAPYNREEGAKFSRVITATSLFCNDEQSKRKVFIFEKSAKNLKTKRNFTFTTWRTSFIEWKVLQNFSRI